MAAAAATAAAAAAAAAHFADGRVYRSSRTLLSLLPRLPTINDPHLLQQMPVLLPQNLPRHGNVDLDLLVTPPEDARQRRQTPVLQSGVGVRASPDSQFLELGVPRPWTQRPLVPLLQDVFESRVVHPVVHVVHDFVRPAHSGVGFDSCFAEDISLLRGISLFSAYRCVFCLLNVAGWL